MCETRAKPITKMYGAGICKVCIGKHLVLELSGYIIYYVQL